MAHVSQKKSRILNNKNNNTVKGQGHPISYGFEGLPTGYPWAKFHNSTINSDLADIVQNDHKWIFSDFQVKIVTLTKSKGTQCHLI